MENLKISNNIKINEKDDRHFRYIKLPNEMKCMLVHD